MPTSEITGGAKQPPCFIFLKYSKDVISAQNVLMYFRLNCLHVSPGGLMPLKAMA